MIDLDPPVWDSYHPKYLLKAYYGEVPIEERPGEGISTEGEQQQGSGDGVSSVLSQAQETQPGDVESGMTGGVPMELDFSSLPTPEEGRAGQANTNLSSLAQEMADFSVDMVTDPVRGFCFRHVSF